MLQAGDAVLLPVGHDSIVFEWEGRHHRCRPDRLTPRQRTLIEVFRHPDKRQDALCGPLGDDIVAHGQVQPILLYQGQILDGRSRYTTCNEVGVAPIYVEEEFAGTWNEAIDLVVSLNYHRRDLTPSQKAMAAAKSIGMYQEVAKKAQREHGGTAPGRKKNTSDQLVSSVRAPGSREVAAEALGTSSTSVERCLHVIKHGAPEVVEAVEDKVISASADWDSSISAPAIWNTCG